jgi:hypothetical protein
MAIQFDPTTRRILQRTLQEAFPDAQVQAHDLEALALALHKSAAQLAQDGRLPTELGQLDLQSCAAQLDAIAAQLPCREDLSAVTELTPPKPGSGVRYYWARATHTRQQPSGYPIFVGELPMVRVSLPASKPQTFSTLIGTIDEADHLLATVGEANDKFASTLGYALQRVDVITPPRQGLRFGAVSVMLGYRDAAGQPTCYLLEAGTATGQAKVLFLGKTLDAKINQYSGYQPTPFSCSDNAYTGTLSLTQDSPLLLHITARKIVQGASQPPYMDLSVVFAEETSKIRNIWSGWLLARAATIVTERLASGLPKGCDKPAVPA